MINFSPLEQFEVVAYFGINLFGINITIINVTVFLGFAFLFFMYYVMMVYYVNSYIFTVSKWRRIIEGIYIFILDLSIEQLGKNFGKVYFPALFCTFIYIFFANLLGLAPYSFTTTSHIIITYLLAFSYNLSFIIIGMLKHGVRFFTLFVPKSIKGLLLPLIITIEVFSYFIRSVSLSVRLFANMLAGHTPIFLILTFSFVLVTYVGSYILAFVPFLFFGAILVLEVVIAMVQAYVFVLLICIYLQEHINLH